jgi:flagella basal body P-ring formation protein FlgA
VNTSGILALNAGDSVEVNCHSCLYGMQQPLTIQILEFDGSRKSFFATADFKKMVKAYRLLSALPSFSSLDNQALLKEEFIESIPHTDLITDLETLKFYKTNKPLRTGDIIKRSDLNAINLVRAGLKTDVVLENQMIRIKTQGISRSNGAIGETVEVFHQQKNKKYQGRVIDINKVLVEL